MSNLFFRIGGEESGQGMAEYALILCFVALAAVFGFSYLGEQIRGRVNSFANSFE
ncbi:MAG: Flp family type IVb pilin [Peptococcaceae bacterium]|nr:Flp family type IVb pilin [Peptococcaceae bacterium]